METAPPPDVDFSTATDEEITAATKDYANDVLGPLAEDVVAAAPAEVASDLEVLGGALEQMKESGDFSVFEEPETVAASNAVHGYDIDSCGWTSYDVTASEYAFAGVPTGLEAGVASFELTNGGSEVHELLLVSKNDGVTETASELLALPEDEAMSKVTVLGEPAFAPPGGTAYTVADLESGDYIALCFIPTGMTSAEGPPPDGLPHALSGMVAEFTVT